MLKSWIMIVVEFEVKPEHRGAFIELMNGHAQRSRAEGRRWLSAIRRSLAAGAPEPGLAGRGVARPGRPRRALEATGNGQDARNLWAVAPQSQGDALHRRLAADRRGLGLSLTRPIAPIIGRARRP